MENEGRGLGLRGDWKEQVNWYGGRIQHSLKIRVDKATKAISFKACPFVLGKSTKVTRRVGSLSILQVKYDDKILYDPPTANAVKDILRRRLVLCGRVFEMWLLKPRDKKAIYVEVKKDFERDPNERLGDQYRMTYAQFLAWMNPINLNSKQTLSKYLTRG